MSVQPFCVYVCCDGIWDERKWLVSGLCMCVGVHQVRAVLSEYKDAGSPSHLPAH